MRDSLVDNGVTIAAGESPSTGAQSILVAVYHMLDRDEPYLTSARTVA